MNLGSLTVLPFHIPWYTNAHFVHILYTFFWKTGHSLYRVHTATCWLWSPEPKFELLSHSFAVYIEKAPMNIQMVLQLKWHMSWSTILSTAQFPCLKLCPNSACKLLECSACLAAHICVNKVSLCCRWTKHHTGVSLLMQHFHSSESDSRHWWSCS